MTGKSWFNRCLFLCLTIAGISSISPALGQTKTETKISDISRGIIVKLSDSISLDDFLLNNNLKSEQVEVGKNGFVLINNFQNDSTDKLRTNDQIDLNSLNLLGADQIEPNGILDLLSTVPNDTYYLSNQWYLRNIAVPTVWDEVQGSQDVVVAVIDTGLLFTHEDLQGLSWTNQNEIADNNIDDDNNGYIDDVKGYNYVFGNNNPLDDNGHGTGVSSIIAANTNNNLGLAGMNWQASIMPLKVCNYSGSCNLWDVTQAIYYAADNGAKVINLSLGANFIYSSLQYAVEYADNHGVLVVASSGNDGSAVRYPAAFPETLAVGAVDSDDNLAYFSNFGPQLDLVAPGIGIFTAYNSNDQSYTNYNGTSFSSPQVAGAAALLLSYDPNLTNQQIKTYLTAGADKVSNMHGLTWDQYYGYGRLNVQNSLNIIKKDQSVASIEGKHESENLYHQIGSVVKDLRASNGKAVQATIAESSGFLQYGPYVGCNNVGDHYLTKFRLKTADNSSSDVLARIEIVNTGDPDEWEYSTIKGTDFYDVNNYQDFFLKFGKNSPGNIEYRIYSYGLADITVDFAETSLIYPDYDISYQSEDLYREAGELVYDESASEKIAILADWNDNGYVQYGPYASDRNANIQYRAIFRLKVENNFPTTDLLRLEVFNHQHPELSSFRTIRANDFVCQNQYEDFGVYFNCYDNDALEYRIFNYGNGNYIRTYLDYVNIVPAGNQNLYSYEAEDLLSQTGTVAPNEYYSGGKARQALVSDDNAGYLVFGPYANNLEDNQDYSISFRMSSNDNQTHLTVAKIDVNNPGGNSPFAYREIIGQNFGESYSWQNFSLDFHHGTGGTMEYRVYFTDVADIMVDNIMIRKKIPDFEIYQAEDLNIGIGRVYRDNVYQDIFVKALAPEGSGFIVYGPYTTDQTPGNYQATFRIKNEGSATGNLARIEAVNVGGDGLYSYLDLAQSDFAENNFTEKTINFTRTANGTMEYRVFTYGQTDISIDDITVEKI
jgi:subtilisin family serine protease